MIISIHLYRRHVNRLDIGEKDMRKPPSKFYKTRKQAEDKRRAGQRIYRLAGKGYYIRQPKSKDSG